MIRRALIAIAAMASLLGGIGTMSSPASAQGSCTAWVAGMVEDEGGEVLTAEACASDGNSYLSLSCLSGGINVREDLAMESSLAPEPGEVTDVTFATSTDNVTLSMTYEDMDGRHATDAKLDDPLIQLLRAGDALTVTDAPGRYPVKHYSLKGSSAAIDQLVSGCH